MERFVAARDALREERRAQVDEWERGNVERRARSAPGYDADGE